MAESLRWRLQAPRLFNDGSGGRPWLAMQRIENRILQIIAGIEHRIGQRVGRRTAGREAKLRIDPPEDMVVNGLLKIAARISAKQFGSFRVYCPAAGMPTASSQS